MEVSSIRGEEMAVFQTTTGEGEEICHTRGWEVEGFSSTKEEEMEVSSVTGEDMEVFHSTRGEGEEFSLVEEVAVIHTKGEGDHLHGDFPGFSKRGRDKGD